jgi:uncharacterized membrane protein YfcA
LGLTGTGGGIFLTPLLLFCRWAHIRQAAAVSALFILVNSMAGLVGYFTAKHSIPSLGVFLAAAAVTGGVFGSHLGSRRFPARTISLLLATVLIIAGTKLILTRRQFELWRVLGRPRIHSKIRVHNFLALCS